jgi:flavodoxin
VKVVNHVRYAMKILVSFYSRSGKTKKIAKKLSEKLKCDLEEIIDTKNRNGIVGFLSAGTDANLKRLTVLKEIKKNPSLYDLIILGSPVWSSNISTPIRTYIYLYKKEFKNVAFFCNRLGSDALKIFYDMEKICQKKPVALLELTSREIVKDLYPAKLKKFIEKIKAKG